MNTTILGEMLDLTSTLYTVAFCRRKETMVPREVGVEETRVVMMVRVVMRVMMMMRTHPVVMRVRMTRRKMSAIPNLIGRWTMWRPTSPRRHQHPARRPSRMPRGKRPRQRLMTR